MKSRSPLITVALAMVGILLVSIGLIALGSRENRSFPSAESFLPSGTSAFAELLRREHYNVVVDHRGRPALKSGDLVIAFSDTGVTNLLTSDANEEQVDKTRTALSDFVEGGGKLLSLPLSPDFASESKTLYDLKQDVYHDQQKATISWYGDSAHVPYLNDRGASNGINVWGTIDEDEEGNPYIDAAFASISKIGEGEQGYFANGIIATNRFIDRQDNAFVLMDLVHRLAPEGTRVVFAEAAFGNERDPGMFETIGPWALAAWFQFVFLGIVMIYTMGKPFGLPDPERRKERGARELMDAIADTLRRGHMTKLALKTVSEDTNRMLRRIYKGRRDVSVAEQENELHTAMIKLQAAAEIGAPEDIAAKMIQDVERLTSEAGRGATRYPS